MKWQQFYNNGSRQIILGGANKIETDLELFIPEYQDFKFEQCQNSTFLINTSTYSNYFNYQQKIFIISFSFFSFIINKL